MNEAAPAASAVRRIGAFVAEAPRTHGALALGRARTAFLDTAGCMLLGASSAPAGIARAATAGWGGGPAVIAGTTHTALAPWAALVNGTAAHAYDFDDYEDPGNTHPSAVLVPALLALADERVASGADLLDAYIVGIEVIMRLGEAVNLSHYNLGWHSTRTLGTLGAAAAAARLMRLDPARAGHAVALAVSSAAGFTSQFGTTAKPLHAGLAAKDGLVAAGLAAAGATAGPATLDGPVGLGRRMAAPGAARFSALDRLGEPWGIEEHGVSIKRHSCCGYIHRAVDAALQLREQGGIAPEGVASIRVSLTTAHRAILPFDRPSTPTEALFSVPYCVATALVNGAVTPLDFSESAIQDPGIRALAGRVSVTTRTPLRPELSMDPQDPDRVEVTLATGATVAAETGAPKGTPADPLTPEEVLEKFRRCAAAAVEPGRADAIAEACGTLDRLKDARALTALLRAG